MINYTLYARDANNQVMAIYKRSIAAEDDNTEPTIASLLRVGEDLDEVQIKTQPC